MHHVKLLSAGGCGLVVGLSLDKVRRQLLWKDSQRCETSSSNDFLLRRPLPGLPIFGTVSAATPLVPAAAPVREVAIDKGDKTNLPSPGTGTTRVSEIMRYGFPSLSNVRARKDYVLSYDPRHRTAHWVFEHLTQESLFKSEGVDRGHSEFAEDESVHPFFRSKNSDYKGSGFDRGHLAPAGNHKQSQEYCNETFYLSNIAPQVGAGFNRDKWEHLERYVRKMTKRYKNVYVCTGPLYLPKRESDGKNYVKYQVIGANNVSVPTHFFKIVVGELDNRDLEMEAFVLPNEVIADNVPLASFMVPPDAIERAAGLLFFDKIAKEQLKKINGKANKK